VSAGSQAGKLNVLQGDLSPAAQLDNRVGAGPDGVVSRFGIELLLLAVLAQGVDVRVGAAEIEVGAPQARVGLEVVELEGVERVVQRGRTELAAVGRQQEVLGRELARLRARS